MTDFTCECLIQNADAATSSLPSVDVLGGGRWRLGLHKDFHKVSTKPERLSPAVVAVLLYPKPVACVSGVAALGGRSRSEG